MNRRFNTDILFGWPLSSIAYCDLSRTFTTCSYAVETLYPNGLAKGPGKTLYAASSVLGGISHFEIKSDDELALIKFIPVPRVLDNIHVDADGSIYAAAIPKIDAFSAATSTATGVSPSEVWRVANATGSGSFFAGEDQVEVVRATHSGLI